MRDRGFQTLRSPTPAGTGHRASGCPAIRRAGAPDRTMAAHDIVQEARRHDHGPPGPAALALRSVQRTRHRHGGRGDVAGRRLAQRVAGRPGRRPRSPSAGTGSASGPRSGPTSGRPTSPSATTGASRSTCTRWSGTGTATSSTSPTSATSTRSRGISCAAWMSRRNERSSASQPVARGSAPRIETATAAHLKTCGRRQPAGCHVGQDED